MISTRQPLQKTLRYSTLGLALLASSSFASPYVGLKLGFANVSGAKSTIDTGIKQVALGYASILPPFMLSERSVLRTG